MWVPLNKLLFTKPQNEAKNMTATMENVLKQSKENNNSDCNSNNDNNGNNIYNNDNYNNNNNNNT